MKSPVRRILMHSKKNEIYCNLRFGNEKKGKLFNEESRD